jgi:hypothetical protein
MDQLNLNLILNREKCEKKLIDALQYFEENKSNLQTSRGIFVYGSPGCGKSCFVNLVLKKLGYDIIKYDAGDVRNKSIIENITKHNMADTNVLSLFQKKTKKIAIIMDEIDGMNSGDKGGINSLIKLIRPKKTKKQKKEKSTMTPIICIGNQHIDKKIKEIMKVCLTIELKTPTIQQTTQLINILMPTLDSELTKSMSEFIQGDLCKLNSTYNIYKNQEKILKNQLIKNMFKQKNYNEDVKDIIKLLFQKKYLIENHLEVMNETDRTSVGLLYHENLVDQLEDYPKKDSLVFYNEILDNICFSDYIDRITFQKQIWIFNEMSSLIKTFYNNYLFHSKYKQKKKYPSSQNVRFTKVLTKYSTEYNNSLFISNLCSQLSMDVKDMFSFFINLRKNHDFEYIIELFNNENYEINKLDLNRIYKFIDCIWCKEED